MPAGQRQRPAHRRLSADRGLHREAGEVAEECQEKVGIPLTTVFAPTAPHPISGFLFMLPTKDVLSVDMNNEETIKFLVSCGMILPESEKTESDEQPF